MKHKNYKKIPNATSRKKKKRFTEYSKFEISFAFITIAFLTIYFTIIHPSIFKYFNESAYVIISEFWILTPIIYLLHNKFKSKHIENKFSLLFKDLKINPQFPFQTIVSKYSNYDKEMILKDVEFSNEKITSYIQVSQDVFKIECRKKDNQISIFSLNTDDSHYPIYVPIKKLENYENFENLLYFYHKSIEVNQRL